MIIVITSSRILKGIGTRAWGDKTYWNYQSSEDKNLQEAYNYCLQKVTDTSLLSSPSLSSPSSS
jgi:hypothetical protein